MSPPAQEEINQNQQLLLISIAIKTHVAFSDAAIQNALIN